jgi:hypothetical protein
VSDFERMLAIALALYMAIGTVFALSVLSGLLARVARPQTGAEWRAFWFANVTCFLRWSTGWLPIVLWYWLREDRGRL